LGLSVVAALAGSASHVPIARFLDAASPDRQIATAALNDIRASWRNGYVGLFLDVLRLMPPRRPEDDGSAPAPSPARRRLIDFLERQTNQRLGDSLDEWHRWAWQQPYDPHPDYPALKRSVYGQIDPRMRAFFPDHVKSDIRLDQIDWGGVVVNGIPPLRAAKVVSAAAADYLKDSNIVFGVSVNGEARAYPKRILAWHEMALDRVGGVDLTIVYCTLCGTVIPFESTAGGRSFRFGTSGLLYESNKLMFDENTNSLWSTFEGRPVVGALVGAGLVLRLRPVVTTTWREWRTAHPGTTVLSLDTGYERDYSEGAAYRDYFASDRLMFGVSRVDRRLGAKDEVLVMRLPTSSGRAPIAIDLRLLRSHRVYAFTHEAAKYLVLTTAAGANRVYALDTAPFAPQPARDVLVDATGHRWRVTEDALLPEQTGARAAPRVAAQRAFWFGWYAQYPDTRLIK